MEEIKETTKVEVPKKPATKPRQTKPKPPAKTSKPVTNQAPAKPVENAPKKEKTPKTVRIYIPLKEGSKYFVGGHNGTFFQYQRGKFKDVPVEFATIIEQSVAAESGSGALEAFRVHSSGLGAHLNF